ncbi:conserved hypothetical protein [Microsporum canis CBS 113480]|uniref:Uncharacterized protein n=1 Tax=Arthroderma otae (strain ATCC MYA-4605 / CBS 113480) TaxID=554155 RepID=C5FPW2_ARTOC|nr:conserved hypothetical protein [Microsporum canis CBS 113480]EEQ31717.1 conserved hypothetical protein [Microsporum canis CBS 113480]
MIAVQDDDYANAIKKLEDAGFRRSVPNRNPPPEIMEVHPNPQQMLDEINAGYKRLDQSCTVFDYPHGDPAEKGMQLYLFPDSFAHIFQQEHIAPPSVEMGDTASTERFNALVESFVKSAIDEEINTGFSAWGESLSAWVSQMTGYLEVNNDILDHCLDKQAVEWYSRNFGRIREAKLGPFDRRISKRLGSGKEMSVDMRGKPLDHGFH